MPDLKLFIQNGSKIYEPALEGNIEWQTERKGAAGTLSFNVIKDEVINYQEGNCVTLFMDGKKIFQGFVFVKKRDNSGIIKTTAYDQLRYLKNKDTIEYENMSLDGVVRLIADKFQLQCGELAPAEFNIAERVEQNKTLFDMIQSAIDLTMQNMGKVFVLYDDCGMLTLRNNEDMRVELLIDAQTAENMDYSTSIDGETFNKIKLYRENKSSGKRDIFIAQDGSNMRRWGVLQSYEQAQDKENAQEKADSLLNLYNRKTRELSIKKAFGDIRVRGGSNIAVSLDLGDVIANTYMLVDKVKHVMNNEEHFMDLTLRGGGLIG